MPDATEKLKNKIDHLKKELNVSREEIASYHKNMDEIEKNIVMMHKKKEALAEESSKLKESIRNMIDFDIKKHPLKKYDAYKKLLALYLDMQRTSDE